MTAVHTALAETLYRRVVPVATNLHAMVTTQFKHVVRGTNAHADPADEGVHTHIEHTLVSLYNNASFILDALHTHITQHHSSGGGGFVPSTHILFRSQRLLLRCRCCVYRRGWRDAFGDDVWCSSGTTNVAS